LELQDLTVNNSW